jgi:aminopeptidase-like protein
MIGSKISDMEWQPHPEVGDAMYALVRDLYPICRSITGDGVRQTLGLVGQHIPLNIQEVPTGTKVFDWTVPKEWNIRDAYIKDASGSRIVDFNNSNLHVVSYSLPVHEKISLGELKKHLFTLPDKPDWIPYRTSYYRESWGFCLSHKQYGELREQEYEVCIDSSLEDGNLTLGEYYLEGEDLDEILISCHVCHPSLCNDNLSGIALSTQLAQHLARCRRRYSYRFLFSPGTIGAISWLALNERHVKRIKHGLVVALVGDNGNLTYKKSRQGNADVDRAVMHVLEYSGNPYEILEFSPYGYDERQYCSPGFDLPVGSLTRTPHGRYAEYHTSADNLELVRPEALADSLSKYLATLFVLEKNRVYVNQNPKCEPQLGRRGLYREMGGFADGKEIELAMLWVLNLSDGDHSLLDIAHRAGLPFHLIERAAGLLRKNDLLTEVSESRSADATIASTGVEGA